MEKEKLNKQCVFSMNKDKSGLKITLSLTQEERALFVIDGTLQPNGMIDIIIN